jgi:hypothetical protein
MRIAQAFTAVLMLGASCGVVMGSAFAEPDEASETGKTDSPAATSTYYSARRDLRRCIAPLCGGWWVQRVNRSNTRCADGVNRSECYVFAIDAAGLGLDDEASSHVAADAASYLFRGSFAESTQGRFTVGVLRASEAWKSAYPETVASGTFYRVDPNRIRCITTPCPVAYHEAELNSTLSTTLSGFTGPLASKLGTELQGSDSVLAAGTHEKVRGQEVLAVTQFWRRSGPAATAIRRLRSH